MKLRRFISNSVVCITLLISSTLLSSCDKEDTWEPQKSHFYGFFDGEINGEKVHLVNTFYETYISKGPWYTNNDKIAYYIQITTPDRKYHFACELMKLEVGTQFITESTPILSIVNDYNSMVCETDKGTIFDRFEVKASRPAKVEITNVEYRYGIHPYPKLIKGNIDAVLYQGNDSVSIKGNFATK